jgi:hypothetical protein
LAVLMKLLKILVGQIVKRGRKNLKSRVLKGEWLKL